MNIKKQFEKNRKIKQIINTIIFIGILVIGWMYYSLLGYLILACMAAGIIIAVVMSGRRWCDWYCPRGSFFDIIGGAISRNKKIPAAFKKLSVRFAFMALLMGIVTWQVIARYPDYKSIGSFFLIPLTVTTVIGLILAVIYHQRAWCYLCPVATISGLIGSKYLKINAETCIDCKLCGKECPMQIEPYIYKEYGIIKNNDCVSCGKCIVVCPKKSIER